jgi:co-chaperonin GroES (HSP10)
MATAHGKNFNPMTQSYDPVGKPTDWQEPKPVNKPPVLPLGYNVLVEILPVQVKSTGGIIISLEDEAERERKGRDLARIIAFGPTSFMGYAGCETPADWGVDVGDIVELSTRYDGKFTRAGESSKKYENYRYVNDQDIMGIANGEFLTMLQKQLEDDK